MAADDHDNKTKNFATTQWSLVARASDSNADLRRKALTELLERYYSALRAHLILRKRFDPDRADDLLQGFISEKVLEQNLVAHADRAKGRFRSFLLRCLENYVIDSIRRENRHDVTIGQGDENENYLLNETVSPTADVFDAVWAHRVLFDSVQQMWNECQRQDRAQIWGVFESRVLKPALGQGPLIPYDELVTQFKFDSPKQASNALITSKKQFIRALQKIVAEYTEDGAHIEEEIANLREILAKSGPLGLDASITPFISPSSEPTDSGIALTMNDSRTLAEILEPQVDRDSIWQDDDLGQILAHQLLLRLDSILEPPLIEMLAERRKSEPTRSTLTTVRDLLHDASPPYAVLVATKDYAKRVISEPGSATPTEVASVVYFACIAASLVAQTPSITNLNHSAAKFGLEQVLERPWVDDATRQLLTEALPHLDD